MLYWESSSCKSHRFIVNRLPENLTCLLWRDFLRVSRVYCDATFCESHVFHTCLTWIGFLRISRVYRKSIPANLTCLSWIGFLRISFILNRLSANLICLLWIGFLRISRAYCKSAFCEVHVLIVNRLPAKKFPAISCWQFFSRIFYLSAEKNNNSYYTDNSDL